MVGLRRQKQMRILQPILIFLLLFLLVFILGSESARVSAQVGIEHLRSETLHITLETGGYVFCEELAINDRNNGPIEYQKANGASVAAGETVAKVFRDDSGTDRREHAAALYAEIELLEAALAQDEEAWQLTYLRAMEQVSERSSAGQIDLAASAAVRAALLRRQARAGAPAPLHARIEVLQAELEAQVRHVSKDPNMATSPADGVFYRSADGYEGVLTEAAAVGLTPQTFRELIATRPQAPSGAPQAVGKVALGNSFSFVISTSDPQAFSLMPDTVYEVAFTADDLTVEMLLAQRTIAEDGRSVLLRFCAEELPAFADAARYRTVRICAKEGVSGLSVPENAMRARDHRDGVYILKDGVAVWRPVRIVYRADGCCLVAPVQPDGEVQTEPLAAGDALIVTARGLYEGKAVSQ